MYSLTCVNICDNICVNICDNKQDISTLILLCDNKKLILEVYVAIEHE